MNAEFNWWLLIVGLVIGGGLAWLVLADTSRREVDIEERERAAESRWIAESMADAGQPINDERVLEILRLHREYRAAPPPDELDETPGHETRWRVHGEAGDRPRMAHKIAPDPDRPDHTAIAE